MAAGRSNLDIFKKIWEWAKENLTKEETNNKFLLAKDDRRRTKHRR